jgi:probable DNA metabolism protein
VLDLAHFRSFEQWRSAVRPALAEGLVAGAEVRMPAMAMQLLRSVSFYRDPGRWELMYRLAHRLVHENPRLLEDAADPDVRHAQRMASAVRRECHKMHAFVRFREQRQGADGEPQYFAWIEPEHEVLRPAVPFFMKRFPNMRWTIATPDIAAIWDRAQIRFIEAPQTRPECSDDTEDLWRTYYRSICNVARINPQMMQREMPKRYWRNLPETQEINGLVRHGTELFARRHSETDEPPVPKAIRTALERKPGPSDNLQDCRRCDLWERATQAVAGEGPQSAKVMLVGEQPGDLEDLRGHPFIGPAGELLDDLLVKAGLDRAAIYVTNAVKHFSWEPRGKRRIHKRPTVAQMSACNVWLQEEIKRVEPRVIVALGATAVRAVTGAQGSIEALRGKPVPHPGGSVVLVTYHPSAILRAPAEQADNFRERLLEDLKQARLLAATPHP